MTKRCELHKRTLSGPAVPEIRRPVSAHPRAGQHVEAQALPPRRLVQRRLLAASGFRNGAWIALVALLLQPATTQGAIEFRGVDLGADYRSADEKLVEYLNQQLGGPLIEARLNETYGDAVLALANRTSTDPPYLARMTPYACVAAEMLGAKFEVLATYQSKATDRTTYSSYLVVNKFGLAEADPELHQLVAILRAHAGEDRTPTFFYHDKFSTSSYFLPALWFRNHGIFAGGSTTQGVFRAALLPGARSSDLVKKVAEDPACLAAVWDGTKADFDDLTDILYEETGKHVRFLKLPYELPNDLLVCSVQLDPASKKKVETAIDRMEADPASHIDIGDFRWWTRMINAPEARRALARLRQLATETRAPVVVRIEAPDSLRDAVQRAVRQVSSEFVVEIPDVHKPYDLLWRLTEIHDGAVELSCSTPDNYRAFEQSFPISFTDAEGDLSKRIVQLIHARMNRIRYIWPYASNLPTILPEVDFFIPRNSRLRVQRIVWTDPERNKYTVGSTFDATVALSDFHKMELTADKFIDQHDFDNPMSNVDYRAMLIRPTHESTTSKVLTLVFLGTFGLAAAGAVIDLRRKSPQAALPSKPCSLEDACLALALERHEPWTRRKVEEAHVMWCDRRGIEEYIDELKSQGARPAFGKTIRIGTKQRLFAGFSKYGIGGQVEWARADELQVDHARVGDAHRLAALLRFMAEKRLFSPFVGEPLEWQALEVMFRQSVASQTGSPPATHGGGIFNTDEKSVVDLTSRHFNQVLTEGLERMSFFCRH